jgi:uncharacterized protein YrrD
VPRGSDLIGLPVLTGPKLKRIGRVHKVLLSTDGARICGLVLDAGGLLHPRRVLDFRAVKAVGDSHLLAEEAYLPADRRTRCATELHGLPVLRGTGEEVGVLDDFHFDSRSGQVTALQLSHGFVDDLLSGKEVFPLAGPALAGEAAILLDGPTE